MESLIQHVKREICTNRWMNGMGAQFKYDEINVRYQLKEMTPDLLTYILPYGRITENSPVVAHGFVAYLIHNWGRPETEIYKEFYEHCLSEYKHREEKEPGAFKRDLNTEYYILHIPEEKARIAYSQKIYPYLTGDDTKLINQYLESYFDFIKIEYSEKSNKSERRFHEFLISKNQVLLAEKLKIEFKGKKGKNLAIMVIALEELNKIAFTGKGEFFNSMKAYMGNIGTETAFNEYYFPYKQGQSNKRKPLLLRADIEPFKTKIESFGC